MDSDVIKFTVRLYPREIVEWDDPRHPRHKEQDMGYPSDDDFERARERHEPPADRCGKHACTEHSACVEACINCKCMECNTAIAAKSMERARARVEMGKIYDREMRAAESWLERKEAIAATGVYCPTEAEIAAAQSTIAQVAPVPHATLDEIARDRSPIDPNLSDDEKRKAIRDHLASIDPTTAALEAQTAEREALKRDLTFYRGAYARALETLATHLPGGHEMYGQPPLEGFVALAIDRISRVTRERDQAHEQLAKMACELVGADADDVAAEVSRLRSELADAERVFELMKSSETRAIAMWKEAHPGSRITFPDRANMLTWLLEQLDSVTREADSLRTSNKMESRIRSKSIDNASTLIDERAKLRTQLTAVCAQRDKAEAQLKVTQERLDDFQGALASLAVDRLKLKERIEHVDHHQVGDLAKARIRANAIENACWDAIEDIPPDVSEFPERGTERVEEVIRVAIGTLIESRRKWLKNCTTANSEANELRAALKRRDEIVAANNAEFVLLHEQLRIADADRVPLRMDLDAANEKLRAQDVMIATMGTVTDKARMVSAEFANHNVAGMWSPLVALLCELGEAVKAYDAASPSSADPDQIDMPF